MRGTRAVIGFEKRAPIISLDADSVEHAIRTCRTSLELPRSFLSTLTALSTGWPRRSGQTCPPIISLDADSVEHG